MHFRISGRVYEKESGLGVQGLMIRAYDKDLLYDDLLGTATTDAQGHFELRYSEADFRELFEHKPDIYLSVYAPPYRFLVDTKDAIRWNADKEETFEVAISRKDLEDCAPTRPDNQVEAGIALPKGSLKIEKRDGFDVPHLPGFATTGTPGAPAVPHQMRFVALPLGGNVLKFEVIPGEATVISGPFNALPAQEPFPDVGTDPETGGGFSVENVQYRMTPPDPRYYEGKKRYPASLAELVKVEEVGPVQIAAVEVHPVQYDPASRSFVYYSRLQYVITFDRENARRVAEKRQAGKAKVGELYAENLNTFLQNERVAVARDIFWPGIVYVLEDTPHVIITDNFQWPGSVAAGGTTRSPTLAERGAALSGDLVAEFQRLAGWRTSHGIRSRVVTISQIVNGTFGDFTEGGFARDLAEVVRNFLKFAQANWDTLYAILGGDVNVVPMRFLTGAGRHDTFGLARRDDDPPAAGQCHFLAGHGVSKLHPAFTPGIAEPLSTYHSGVRVPYNREAGPGQLGWYFTTETDFNSMSEGFSRRLDNQPTQFVIVEGPESIIDDDYYWLRDVNSIPSDFYYASLVGPGYSVHGKHDFDDNNNGLYGQSHSDPDLNREVTLDEVDLNSDVWVGRVPAESAAQVQAFVNKVITYEDLRTPGETTFVHVDTDYLRKILYASDHWSRQGQSRQVDTSTAPAEARFTHVNGTTLTKIRTAFDLQLVSDNPSFRLVARLADTETIIPYNTTPNAAVAGWNFTTSSSYASQSNAATRFIRVEGPEATINPSSFFWDPVGLTGSAEEKEQLRGLMNSWFPNFDDVQRHYTDYFDLGDPPPIVPLEFATVQAAINTGQHFLSLSGHGNPGGCCNVNSGADFTNSLQYFIAFANSCSTARPDGFDSLGEVSVIDPNGGAVAYVGNTRYGWIGIGDNFEEMFWCLLASNGMVGPAAGMRLATDGISSLWTFYTQTLFGDPAMRVWDHVPSRLVVRHPFDQLRGVLPVEISLGGKPLRDARVTVTGGQGERAVFQSKKTNPDGRASFTLPAGSEGELLITVSTRKGQLYRGVMRSGEDTKP